MSRIDVQQTILIVEDSDDDYEATVRAFKKTGNLKNPLARVDNGQSALDFLNQQGEYDRAPRPGIVLLDLNMPGIDGRTVLSEIKSSEKFREIPVVVLTTSSDERDIEACYAEGANTYITKPVDLEGFFKAIERLKEYWFEIAILPK
jgi:two-component system response regulator